ncbi:YggS family pyridoxal phosphate-dependent enzyme [Desulfonatronovibrio magnus]|uniref:YggS family pyridoxal phosphate-dependent enzyme n=1 Tax=Desulfonatronovibrio magnus TaxID=698827 RepID=UPI000A5FB56F|nr:YggS family pyridoxal phosphate-dependent enzyme [Desulfonatronovibrio magnus]
MSAEDKRLESLKAVLRANLDIVRERVDKALEKSNDPGRKVTIVAVSKRQSVEKIRILSEVGHMDFGESYVQEAEEKMHNLKDLKLRMHFIGALQTNKARFVAGKYTLVHSVGSVKLARYLHKKAQGLEKVQPVLIQVNLAGEEQKAGVTLQGLTDLATEICNLRSLRLQGLMIMPPFSDDPEKSRPYFAGLRRCRNQLEKDLGLVLPDLSMGMSNDYAVAVEEGANLVRVGTTLFGPRTAI